MKRIAGGVVWGGLLLVGVVVGGSGALAQSAPGRIVQASDGTLYLLKDGARHAIIGEAIEDDELSNYADGEAVSGSVLLPPVAATGPAVGQPNGGASVAEEAPQMPNTETAPAQAAPAAQAEPVAGAPAAQPACVAAPTRAKQSASCAAPSPAPVTNGFQFARVQGNTPGRQASVTVQAAPGAACSIGYVTSEGRRGTSTAALSQQSVGASGVVTWSYLIDAAAQPGTATVTVTCDGASISGPIQIAAPVTR